MAAYFTAMIAQQWEGRSEWFSALAAVIAAIAGLYLLPAGWNIVLAAMAGGTVAALRHEH